MSKYQDLVHKAWRSGEYQASDDKEAKSSESGDAETLRSFIRSKMEWIAARESYDPNQTDANTHGGRTMKLAQYVKFREEKFGGVLFETRSEKVFTLSPTGAAVVKELVAGGDEAAVVTRLTARYDDKTGAMEKEAKEFIASLRTQGLVTE